MVSIVGHCYVRCSFQDWTCGDYCKTRFNDFTIYLQ